MAAPQVPTQVGRGDGHPAIIGLERTFARFLRRDVHLAGHCHGFPAVAALGARKLRFCREATLRRVLVDGAGKLAGQSRKQLVPRQSRLFRQGFQHLGADRPLELGRCELLVGAGSYPGIRSFAVAALLEAVHELAEPTAQHPAGTGTAAAELAEHAAYATLPGSPRLVLSKSTKHFS